MYYEQGGPQNEAPPHRAEAFTFACRNLLTYPHAWDIRVDI